MTPSERSVRLTGTVASLLNIDPDKDTWHKSNLNAVQKEIAAAIEEAIKEGTILCKWHSGYRRFCSTCVKECQEKSYSEGFNAARERASRIIEKEAPSARSNGYRFVADRYEYLAQRISEMKPEGK